MRINANLSNINLNDTIVVANNRQVLAFKRTFSKQNPNTQLPKVFSWQQYLKHYWQSHHINNNLRLIDAIEKRYLLESSVQLNQQKISTQLIDEVVKNNDYCCNHLINLSILANSKIQACEVFARWIKHYQQNKTKLSLIDSNDLANLLLTDKTPPPAPYVYGFKTLTPLQQKVFEKLNYQPIHAQQTQMSEQFCFDNTLNEITKVATWAKQQQDNNANDSIVIVCPQLSQLQHQLISIFDQIFNSQLIETGKKYYNISLGLPLNQYGLIQNLLNILTLTQQLKINKINTHLFNQVVCCVYIKNHQLERSARYLLSNQVNSLEKEYFQLNDLNNAFEQCPVLLKIIENIKSIPTKTQALSRHLLTFNTTLDTWGFTSDRNLSSTEYQLFQKYSRSILTLNQLSQQQKKCSATHALNRLKDIISQVVFQAQSSTSNVQIIGALEAEGLHFDKAWVMGMNHDFLPAKLNSPKFISSSIASEHQIPFSSYELIQIDGRKTLNNLKSLANKVIFSYAQSQTELEQLPSPLLDFPTQIIPVIDSNPVAIDTESINDYIAPKFEADTVKSGVTLLKNQMECAFKGFSHRLNIKHFDEPHIGLNKREQGNIIHNALQYIYEEINSQEALLKLDKTELNTLVSRKVYVALKRGHDSKFKTIEQIRITQLLLKFIETDKLRENFRVLSTEQSIEVDIAGLNFNTRLDRLDEMDNGDKIIFDYKTADASASKWCGQYIAEPQLPIYSITNNTQGASFIELHSDAISFKGLSKDPDSLPKQSKGKNSCQEWDEQLIIWKNQLNQASQDFQSGEAQVLPNKNACNYCEFDLLCRIEK